jgi:hypothetical protein
MLAKTTVTRRAEDALLLDPCVEFEYDRLVRLATKPKADVRVVNCRQFKCAKLQIMCASKSNRFDDPIDELNYGAVTSDEDTDVDSVELGEAGKKQRPTTKSAVSSASTPIPPPPPPAHTPGPDDGYDIDTAGFGHDDDDDEDNAVGEPMRTDIEDMAHRECACTCA